MSYMEMIMPMSPAVHRGRQMAKPVDNRPSASLRGYGGTWQRLRKMILARQPVCMAPGCNRPAQDVHHIVSLREGGINEFDNL